MTVSFIGRGNQYIQLVKTLYCKLPTISEQLPTFEHDVQSFLLQASDVGCECVTLWSPLYCYKYFVEDVSLSTQAHLCCKTKE